MIGGLNTLNSFTGGHSSDAASASLEGNTPRRRMQLILSIGSAFKFVDDYVRPECRSTV